MPRHSPIDPAQVRDGGDWEVFEVTPDYRRSRLWLDDNSYIMRTEYLAEDTLLEANRQAFNDSHGKRFGDGKVVGRIPLNVLYDPKTQLVEKIRDGDQDHMKWWLDRDEAKPFRTFRGRLK